MDERIYSKKEVCDMLNISTFTLETWYRWEKKELENEEVVGHYLPQPLRLENTRGKPLRWTYEMIEELKYFQSQIVRGRNGRFGKYTNAKWH